MLNDIVRLKFLIGDNSIINWRMLFTFLFFMIVQVIASVVMDYKVYKMDNISNEISELEYDFSQTRFKLQTVKLESNILKNVTDIKQSKEPPKEIIVKVKK